MNYDAEDNRRWVRDRVNANSGMQRAILLRLMELVMKDQELCDRLFWNIVNQKENP